MLECLKGQGHIYATDVDPEESAKTKKRLEEQGFGEEILTVCLQNFCTIDEIAEKVGGFDFILADLGVSSMQIDNPKRGFSFKADGPLDLRLNQEKGISAAERLDTISREELAGMLYENSDEPYCEELAKAITDEIRRGNRIDTTTKLRNVIEKTLSFLPDNQYIHDPRCSHSFVLKCVFSKYSGNPPQEPSCNGKCSSPHCLFSFQPLCQILLCRIVFCCLWFPLCHFPLHSSLLSGLSVLLHTMI